MQKYIYTFVLYEKLKILISQAIDKGSKRKAKKRKDENIEQILICKIRPK
jgi:hypothetical protein